MVARDRDRVAQMAEVGRSVRAARVARGLTLEAVGSSCGLLKAQVWRVERGASVCPTHLARVAGVLGLSLDGLFGLRPTA